jgi:signal transduction histidine kinase
MKAPAWFGATMNAGLLTRATTAMHAKYRRCAVAIPPTIIAAVVLVCGMAVIAAWVGTRLEDGILQRAASEAVLNMDNFIKPLVQDLARGPDLPEAAQQALSAVLIGKMLGREVAVIKIWSPLGTVSYSNRREIIGRTYPIFNNLRQAFNGRVVAEFDDLNGPENEYERTLDTAFLEIYAPVRESGTNRIIAVAEFYEIRDHLQIELRAMRLQTWAVMGSLTITMIALLSGIMIKQKRQVLEKRVVELSCLLAENNELQSKIRNSHYRMAEINELFLRRVSAELHDAPAQLIGFALLRLDALRPPSDNALLTDRRADQRHPPGTSEFETIRNALTESLKEIRTISAGLAPPELADLSLAEALEMAVSRHVRRTETTVYRDIGRLPDYVDPSLKICLYRFTQEGLNNSLQHAGGRGQMLRAHCDDGLLEVVISDDGAAPDDVRRPCSSGGLGLKGLQGRVESLGGVFEFRSQPGRGVRLTARFNLARVELLHA